MRGLDEELAGALLAARLCMVAHDPSGIDADNATGLLYDAKYLLDRGPGKLEALLWMARGNTEAWLGRREAARASYERAAELRPRHPAAYMALGRLYGSEPDGYDEAMNAFARAMEVAPDNRAAYLAMGQLRTANGELDDTVVDLERALAIRDGYDVRMLLGDAELRRKRFAEAAEHFTKALEAKPNDLVALRSLGRAELAAGRPTEAASALETALRQKPDPKIATSLGFARLGQKRYREALSAFDAVLAKDANDIMALWGAASAAEGLGSTKLAIRLYRRVLEEDAEPGLDAEQLEEVRGQAKTRLSALGRQGSNAPPPGGPAGTSAAGTSAAGTSAAGTSAAGTSDR